MKLLVFETKFMNRNLKAFKIVIQNTTIYISFLSKVLVIRNIHVIRAICHDNASTPIYR